ncbi:DUF2274 domain-containing protein [Sphingobium herbicidovorans]|jgi:hypothetical protein|nr:DUF2274 domain-containing protein [Kaistia sp.]
MAKLKLGAVPEDKRVKISLELPGELFRDLQEYSEILAQQEDVPAADPSKLILAMVQRFIQTDRGFARARKDRNQRLRGS